ncbi:hypothetical protein RQ832_23445, partial [Roseomonas sp. DSM 102946]|nr:hypothetical protein [Roseomonas sp. DSM 102946]
DDRLRDRTRLNAVVSGPGDGQGIMIGTESPLQSGRTLVAVTGTTPQGVEAMLNALSDPDQLPRIQGDVAWLSGGRVESYRISPTYSVGSLPVWLWPQLYLGNRPDMVLLLVVGAALLLAAPSYWIIRRRVAARLRAQI